MGGARSGEYEAPEPNDFKNRATGGVLQSTQFHTFPPLGHVSLHKPVRKTLIEGKRGNEPPLRLPLLSTQDRTHFPRGSMRAELARGQLSTRVQGSARHVCAAAEGLRTRQHVFPRWGTGRGSFTFLRELRCKVPSGKPRKRHESLHAAHQQILEHRLIINLYLAPKNQVPQLPT